MKHTYLTTAILLFVNFVNAQIPVNMAAQKNYSYTETFSDINNWIFNTTQVDGTFAYGIGADAWKGIIAGGTTTVPSATKITAGTTAFIAPLVTNGVSGNPGSSSSGGLQRYYESLLFLSTSTSDNTTATAIDFFMDFTGLNAGVFSYDWNILNNGAGSRNASFKVYYSVDGNSFTELTNAGMLNFSNNQAIGSGSITNISLPSVFNNSANARLRFYYYNGTGGTSGSRPKFIIDNVKVTAIAPNSTCVIPTAQPTNFVLGTTTNYSIQANFTMALPASDNYMIVASSNNALSSNPVNGTTYAIGDNLGDGSVVAFTHTPSFTVTGLAPTTTYHLFVYAVNSTCSGGPLYATDSPLLGAGTTLAGGSSCVAPAAQPNTLSFVSNNTSTIKGNFKASASTDEYLVVRSTSSTPSTLPVNKTIYNAGDVLGGGVVVARSADLSFSALGLSSGTQYYFFVYSLTSKSCNNGPTYNSALPLTGTYSTTTLSPCTKPIQQPTALNITASNVYINGNFTAATTTDEYLVLASAASVLTLLPQDGINYTVGNTLGNATIVSNATATSFYANNLTASTMYYFYVFSKNSICTNGPQYLTANPLIGNTTTTATAALNYYFGNLHAHTVYSDGGKDNSNTNPTEAYNYAKNSLCMDYLGISEHNHAGAGMNVANWQPGVAQAAAATSTNFLALYGMEWGVISNGGHVLVYGSNQLLGWEAGNYNIYVPKSDYLSNAGLFRTLNAMGNNAFASLAHPNFTDYGNIANNTLNAIADSAIAGAAISSGPAFSTSTTYADPATSLGYYEYFKTMLAKGYHIGPLMDHDNHNTTFGRTSNTRTVFIAPSLNQTEFLKAMKGRHFYATEDCDTRVNFVLNNQLMGSIFSGSTLPAISINVTDPTNPLAIAKINIMYGNPGSGINAIAIDSVTANTLNFTDYNALNGSTGYYFAEITIAGNKVVTAPIWYTYSTVLPVSLLSFKATITNNKMVTLHWVTANEINNKIFIIEKSSDGVHFSVVDSVSGAGNSSLQNNYSIIDAAPFEGINYYRLQQMDTDGKSTFSNVVSVNLNQAAINYFTVYPNPVGNQLTLNIHSKSEQSAKIIITDVFGRTLQATSIELFKGNQFQRVAINQLAAGNYNITILFNDTLLTKKVVKM